VANRIDSRLELELSREEAWELYDFLLHCGYICTETRMPIHILFRKVSDFLSSSSSSKTEPKDDTNTEV
jgi:hypothetical protein